MLLKLEPEHDVAVVEMGMSHAGEIAALAKIAQPEIGVVTNVAPVHLEFFNSIADIARAKYELIESLPANGTAVLNADDEYVSQFGRDFKGKVVTYGFGASADVRAENIRVTRRARARHLTSWLAVFASRVLCRWWESTMSIMRWPRLRSAIGRGFTLSRRCRRLGNTCARRTNAERLSAGQHHSHQRLLQFQSEGACRDGGCVAEHARKAPDCCRRRNARTRAAG